VTTTGWSSNTFTLFCCLSHFPLLILLLLLLLLISLTA
jgi:hypothetical protein